MSEENELLFDELYEKTKDYGRVQFIKLLMQRERENQELKKQLEEKTKIGVADHKYASKCEDKVITMENQQKEFISYLENEMKSWKEALTEERDYELVQEFAFKCNIYEEILSKYKEIIGVKDER